MTMDILTIIDFFARDEKKPSIVNVTAKAYRRVALYEAGGNYFDFRNAYTRALNYGVEYTATLTYNNGTTTKATWLVRDLQEVRKAKNIILFVGDGMTTNMITVYWQNRTYLVRVETDHMKGRPSPCS